MMKITLNKLAKEEKGQALLLVIILLLVGALIITPLLGFMSTGLMAGQLIERKVDELYAADAGIEDALHKLVNVDASLPATAGDTWTLPSIVVNGKDVTAEIVLEEDAEDFIKELEGATAASDAHEDWTVVGEALEDGTYTLEITYEGEAEMARLQGAGAWFQGGQWDIDGLARGLTEDFPEFTFEQVYYKGGIAFMWSWGPAANKMPLFDADDPDSLTTYLEFDFSPVATPDVWIGWSYAQAEAIGIVTGGTDFGIWKVTATATDSATGNNTEVISYVSSGGKMVPYKTNILTWDITLP